MKKNDFQNLCLKSLSKNISDEENKKLKLLLEESAQNRLEYEKTKKLWEDSSPLNLNLDSNTEIEWIKLNNIMKTLNEEKIEKTGIAESIKTFFNPGLRPAFSLGALLILIISSILYFTNNETERILKTISTTNNEHKEITLSDGSLVKLNSGSELEYYENFEEDKREIKLNGEAFFSVKKDGRPFIISTENAVTTVLGTQFNVWSRDKETRVIVKEGRVSLAENRSLTKAVVLSKDEYSKVVEAMPPSEPENVNAEEMLGWMNGRIVFNGTVLDEIAGELERYYDVKITFGNDKISGYSLTGSFENEEIDTVLAKICLALDLKYIEHENGYKLLE